MVPKDLLDYAAHILEVPVRGTSPVTGGCIHRAVRLDTDQGPFFLKFNQVENAPMFHAEMRGLLHLAQKEAIPTANVICSGQTTHHAFLLLQWIEAGPRQPRFWETFGSRLAALHRHTAPSFGLDHDNFIGSLPQSNTQHTRWAEFLIHQRLDPQLQLATQKGLADKKLIRQFHFLYQELPDLLPDAPPALLHGDLWSGNFMTNAQGQATLIDPAVYYGHREADIAFTRLFGGFTPGFYHAYNEAWPLTPGWEDRLDLFNLYPLMVHLNLFGRSYLPDIQETLRRFA